MDYQIPPAQPITGPSAWKGSQLRDQQDWIQRLTDRQIAELEDAVAHSKKDRIALIELTREVFPLPTLGPLLDELRADILRGRGFVLLRGIPVERYEMEDIARLYLGLGSYLGRPVSQNAMGHLLGHIIDIGRSVDDPSARTYQTNARQYFHADSCDIVGLLCLRKAKSGGNSAIISSVTLFNEILERRPDLLPVLCQPFAVDRRGEVPAGQKPWYDFPVFNWHGGLLTTYYIRRYIESARRFPEIPPLTEQQIAALDLVDELVDDPELHLQMAFEPGDIQLLHNPQILHDRTAFEDWPEPERRRHLLRLWLCPPDGRPLPPYYAERWGSVEIGNRGGIRVPGSALTVPLSPEKEG